MTWETKSKSERPYDRSGTYLFYAWRKSDDWNFSERKAETFDANKKVAGRWGKVAWHARQETEKELSNSVISEQNFLPQWGKKKLK